MQTSDPTPNDEVISLSGTFWPWLMLLGGAAGCVTNPLRLALGPELAPAARFVIWAGLGGSVLLVLLGAVWLAWVSRRKLRLRLTGQILLVEAGEPARVVVKVPYRQIAVVRVAGTFLFRYLGLQLRNPDRVAGPEWVAVRDQMRKRFGFDMVIPADLSRRRLEAVRGRIVARQQGAAGISSASEGE